jgi:aspartate carbamoyltransferase regulatory subunit
VSKRKKKQTNKKPVSKITVIKPGATINLTTDNLLHYEKKYQYDSPHGSNTEITMTANIKNLNKDDLQEIVHEFASRTHNFYICLGNEINNKP